MDSFHAKALSETLIGKQVGDWLIVELVNSGKSAAVFRATRGELVAAVKIFDKDLIERFGSSVQLERINRELQLKDEDHPNLVRIYDGGYDDASDSYFVAMEFIPASNLEDSLHEVTQEDIPIIIKQLALAAKRLEELGLVHRDIKPSNIVYHKEFKRLTLLDLGVLGPIGGIGKITDQDGRPFIGTLQYSSPEYLLREEEDTADGWRALTFYQIGAVMHDLIMRRPIFQEFSEPYSRLVNAVQHEQPVIQSSNAPYSVIELARRCLLKRPDVRLSLITWEDFDRVGQEVRTNAKERVTNRVIVSNANREDSISSVRNDRQRVEIEVEVSRLLRDAFRTIRSDNTLFPPVTVVPNKGSGGVHASFKASDRHHLPDGLRISVRCNVVDPSEGVVMLGGQTQNLSGASDQEVVFFKGVIDSGAIYAALEDFVYSALDAAQTKAI